MAIYTLDPVYQPKIWGGQNLKSAFNRPIPEEPIGEAWEVCDRPEAQSGLQGSGQTLHALWASTGRKKIFGTKAPQSERFPILIKILDAQQNLSLQVHPPAALAPKFKGEPKTEMWYFLETQENACIYVGLKKGVTRDSFAKAITEKNVAACFHQIPTSPGEAMFLPSGRVHAIGAGNLILEIQQNSDTTFRVYDWDRVDEKTGQPRDLHIAESMECIHFNDYEPVFAQPHGEHILTCAYFSVYRSLFFEKEERELGIDPSSFQYFFTARGRFKFGGQEIARGTSVWVTADHGPLLVEALDEFGELVSVTWP
jgi:mannose-6-phosphate isomerase